MKFIPVKLLKIWCICTKFHLGIINSISIPFEIQNSKFFEIKSKNIWNLDGFGSIPSENGIEQVQIQTKSKLYF